MKNPSYLELRPVSREPHAVHAGFHPVRAGGGKTVYAAGEIIVDLRDFDCASARVVPVVERPGESSVKLQTTREGGARLMEYTGAHVAEPIGIFVAGELFMWAVIRERFGNAIQVQRDPPLSSVEAEQFRATIAAGGKLE